MNIRMRRRRGFSLVEVIVALTLFAGVLLGFAHYAQPMLRSNQAITTTALASDLAVARLEQIKAWRPYSTLISTFNSVSETWSGTDTNAGFTRQTFVTRTGPTTQADYMTVTVVVSGRQLNPPVRRTTSIAAF